MTATEPLQAGPYPEPTDAPDGPNQLAALATWAAGRLVMRFASTVTRDAAVTAPVEGMRCITGTGAALVEWVYRSGAWQDVTVLPGTDYTPALAASTTNPTLGTGGATTGRYSRVGKMVTCVFGIAFGTSGVAAGSGNYSISLPLAMRSTNMGGTPLGVVALFDSSTSTTVLAHAYLLSSTTVQLRHDGGSSVAGAAVPWAWAASDSIRGTLVYEAA